MVLQKNIPPRTRLQRRQMQDKESLEKARLREVSRYFLFQFLRDMCFGACKSGHYRDEERTTNMWTQEQ